MTKLLLELKSDQTETAQDLNKKLQEQLPQSKQKFIDLFQKLLQGGWTAELRQAKKKAKKAVQISVHDSTKEFEVKLEQTLQEQGNIQEETTGGEVEEIQDNLKQSQRKFEFLKRKNKYIPPKPSQTKRMSTRISQPNFRSAFQKDLNESNQQFKKNKSQSPERQNETQQSLLGTQEEDQYPEQILPSEKQVTIKPFLRRKSQAVKATRVDFKNVKSRTNCWGQKDENKQGMSPTNQNQDNSIDPQNPTSTKQERAKSQNQRRNPSRRYASRDKSQSGDQQDSNQGKDLESPSKQPDRQKKVSPLRQSKTGKIKQQPKQIVKEEQEEENTEDQEELKAMQAKKFQILQQQKDEPPDEHGLIKVPETYKETQLHSLQNQLKDILQNYRELAKLFESKKESKIPTMNMNSNFILDYSEEIYPDTLELLKSHYNYLCSEEFDQ